MFVQRKSQDLFGDPYFHEFTSDSCETCLFGMMKGYMDFSFCWYEKYKKSMTSSNFMRIKDI